jgi:hypothetical protein
MPNNKKITPTMVSANVKSFVDRNTNHTTETLMTSEPASTNQSQRHSRRFCGQVSGTVGLKANRL